MNTKTYPGFGDTLTYNHDALGRIITKTDQLGDTCTNTYDLASRLTEKTYKTAGTTTESTDTYTYDEASRILTTVKGRHNITTEHTYALDGLPLTETLIADNRTYLSTRTYDAANRPLTHTFPSGETTHWAYDARNLVTTVHYEDKLITTNTHDDGYRLTHQTFGNGLDRNINYNRLDNLRSTDSLKDGTQTIDDLTMIYQYAHDKQITAEQIAGGLLPSSGFTSSYDAGNRLTNWNRTSTTASAQTWNYDDAGNWNSTAKTIGTNTTTEARTHSAADQINTIAGNAATHDLKGNLTEYEQNGKEYTVTYDLDNRIITADVDNNDVEYRYDAFGRRVIRKQGSTTTSLIWWGNSECAEHKHQAGQTVIQNDIFEHPSRLNSVIARAIDGSKFKLQWYHKNYLDHVYGVSDDSGHILEHYRYTAFGEVTIYDENGGVVNTTQIDNDILWNTRRRDAVTGYYIYKYRHYSAELGRWPSRDPIEESGGINLYGFVGNDPVSRWDRLGLVEPGAWEDGEDPSPGAPVPSVMQKAFDEWYESEKKNMGWIKGLADCPCDISCKKKETKCVIESIDSSYPGIPNYEIRWVDVEVDSICIPDGWKNWGEPSAIFHPGGAYDLRKKEDNGTGQQCIYDKDGKLITEPAGAGTADKSSPSGIWDWPGIAGHGSEDVGPYRWALDLDGNPKAPDPNGRHFKKYMEVRPTNNGNNCDKNPK